jgi:hypothetical protein
MADLPGEFGMNEFYGPAEGGTGSPVMPYGSRISTP